MRLLEAVDRQRDLADAGSHRSPSWLTSNGAFTIHNSFAVNGDFSFLGGINTLILDGSISLSTGSHNANVDAPQETLTLAGSIGGTGGTSAKGSGGAGGTGGAAGKGGNAGAISLTGALAEAGNVFIDAIGGDAGEALRSAGYPLDAGDAVLAGGAARDGRGVVAGLV